MANNAKVDYSRQRIEKDGERSNTNRLTFEQKMSKIKDKIDEAHLPTPLSDPWMNQWYLRNSQSQPEMTDARNIEEDEEDILVCFTDLEAPLSDSQASECPSRNSTTSTITVPNLCLEEAFDQLNRLYSFTEQILEVRQRTSKFFKRVRNLEKMKVLRNANRVLEDASACNYDFINDFCEEDTGFADSLLDAMISNCREPPFQRWNIRPPSSRRTRNKFDLQKQTSGDSVSKDAPKVSKWTRVKAAFKWERAYANDIMEATATTSAPATPIAPATKHLGVPHVETGDSNSSSPYIEEASDTTSPFCQTWTAPLPNEVFHERSPKNVSNHSEHSCSKMKEDQRKKCINRSSQSLDCGIAVLHTQQSNEDVREKQAIRVTDEKNGTVCPSNGIDEKVTRLMSKTPTPSLTVTIPALDDDIRCVSSAESNSSLSSCTHTTAGSFPLFRNIHSEQPTVQHIKRQQSTIEESVSPRVQRQDSRWNKVRRAFLSNSAHSVPPSPVKDVSRHMFLQNGQETSTPDSYSASAEDLEQIAALNARSDTRRDYRVLREKLGTEFHRKLIEWERLKNLSPSLHTKDNRDVSSTFVSPREQYLSEESLSYEFRKKLQDWKRIKKERRGSAPYEQQRFNRRRLTDWQLWKSPSKIECRHREIAGQDNSCGESVVNGGRTHLSESLFQKLDVRKRMNDTTNADVERSSRPKLNRLGIGSGIDDSEFLTLEKALSLFNGNVTKKRRENDVQQMNKLLEGNSKSYIDPARNMNYIDEVPVQTASGFCRFEGMSQEFVGKLYDWEKYRGISPGSSTFRLLGPISESFLKETNIEAPMTSATKIGCGDQAFYNIRNLRRSKSADDPNATGSLTESFIRRSMSLQLLNHLENTLTNSTRLSTLLISNDRHELEEITEDILMDDSEPEAMIVDIEDVIEETASPLKRMQPHQTPVYSVAASETTSIAVPVGTVTSNHELSPLLLIEEENSNKKQYRSEEWEHRDSSSEKDTSSLQQFESENFQNDRRVSNQKDVHSKCSSNESFHRIDSNLHNGTIETDIMRSINQNQTCEPVKILTQAADKGQLNDEKKEIFIESSNDGSITETVTRHSRFHGLDKCKIIGKWNGKYSSFPRIMTESTDLSSEKTHERESDDQKTEEDGGSCNVENVTDIVTEHDNKYENVKSVVDPYYCSLIEMQPVMNNKTCNEEASLESSGICKTEKTDYANSCHTNQENQSEPRNLNREHLVKINLDSQSLKSSTEDSDHEKQNNCIVGGAIFKESTVTQNQRQEYTLENIVTSKLSTKDSINDKHNYESLIQTVSLKASPSHEESCVDEKLKRVTVPTVSDSCTESMKTLQQLINDSASNNLTRGHDRQLNNNENASNKLETKAKKPYSPTRNVFTKTKRAIFSPFRREDYHSARKESKSFEDNQVSSLKNEGKSKSASPKINRRDILVRTTFSLPWALCLSSKKIELKETKTEEVDAKAGTNIVASKDDKPSLSSSENTIFQKSQIKSDSQTVQHVNPTAESVKEEKKTISNDLQNRTSMGVASPRVKREDEEKGKALSLEFDPNSADLIHKLQILSGVVAKRDGRNNVISEELSVESHSLRTRRAKEDFLSRRGGPLFHSVMEPPTFNGRDSRAANDLNAADTRNDMVTPAKASNSNETKQEAVKADGETTVVNEGSRSADASLSIREKSASTGVINVDPDILKRLIGPDRGCESLPRATSKQQQQSGGSLTKIINKFNFVRLICGKEQNNLNTIARLCRQSLLIDIRNDLEQHWEDNRADKTSKKE